MTPEFIDFMSFGVFCATRLHGSRELPAGREILKVGNLHIKVIYVHSSKKTVMLK